MPTSILRWDPFRELASLRADMDRLFGRIAEAGEGRLPHRWTPTSDVVETDDAIVITAELPGVKDEDIEITVQDGMLRIAGTRDMSDEVSEDRYHRIERSYGSFERTFTLPRGTTEKDISAKTAYGVLWVTVPKPAAPAPARIPVAKSGA